MINDGGAERMVRNHKVTWYQILAVVIMTAITIFFGLFVYFTFNGQKLVNMLDRSNLKDGYNMLKAVKENFEDVAIYGYEQSEDKVFIEFRYYEEVLEKETDLILLSTEVRDFITDYLKNNPDDAICDKQKKLDLRFPDVHYSNYLDGQEFIYSNDLLFVTYEYSGISAEDFIEQADKIGYARVLSFVGGEGMSFDDNIDFSAVFTINGLEKICIDEEYLSEESKEKLRVLCEEHSVILEK